MKKLILIMSMSILIPAASIAQPMSEDRGERKHMSHKMRGSEDRLDRMAERLELTDDQKNKIESIHMISMKSTKALKNQIGEKEARLKTLSTSDEPDLKAIEKVAREIGDLRTEVFINKVQTKQKVRALLDEKQKLKFDHFQNKRHMEFGGRHGSGRRHGHG